MFTEIEQDDELKRPWKNYKIAKFIDIKDEELLSIDNTDEKISFTES